MMPSAQSRWTRLILGFLSLVAVSTGALHGKIQFDVFPGFDSVARGGGWFPVVIEVFNDGPSFDAVVELGQGQMNLAPSRFPVELPQNTRKRLVLPLFASGQGIQMVEARLLDADGKLRADNGQRVTQLGWENFLLGAAPQGFSGMPSFPEVAGRNNEFQPRAVRMSIGQGMEGFPDNPIVLGSLNAIYLNTAKALELKEPQVEALLAWLHAGGHLIVAVDQPTDVTSTAWLRDLLPVEVSGLGNRPVGKALTDWLKGGRAPGVNTGLSFTGLPAPLPVVNHGPSSGEDPFAGREADPAFQISSMPVAGFRVRAGETLAETEGVPLMVGAVKGRGVVTAVAFNPERDPVRSWKERPWFWAKLSGVPRELLNKSDFNAWGGRGIDGIFGAMVETRQVRKLPVGVLVLLLLVYLVVIGPVDQMWLKKINRPMLTWITFPAYVVLFSVLIYYIGFRLRAGKTEWSELQVVDVYPRSGDVVLRGYNFGSVYSPANDNYPMAVEAGTALLRPEFQGFWGNGSSGARIGVKATSKGLTADVDVPVWSSQLVVGEWMETAPAPILARWEGKGIRIANRRQVPMTNVMVIHNSRLYRVGTIESGAEEQVILEGGESSYDFARNWGPRFDEAAARRAEVFGSGGDAQFIDQWAEATVAASFPQYATTGENGARKVLWPPGFDLSPLGSRGDALIFAYLPGDTLVPGMNRFTAVRQAKGTVLRLVLGAKR